MPPHPSTWRSMYDNVETNISRALMFQVALAKPMEHERIWLRRIELHNSNLVQSYYVWRWSCLVISCPFLVISMILEFVDLISQFQDVLLTGWGKFLTLINGFNLVILLVFVIIAVSKETSLPKSMNFVRLGWLITFIIPLIQGFFPFPTHEKDVYVFNVVSNMEYIIQLLPILLTFSDGIITACVRIRWLIQNSSLPGWILLACAPICSMVTFCLFLSIMHLAGNGALVVGMILIVLPPWLYLTKRKLLVRVWDNSGSQDLEKQTHRIISICALLGYVLVIIWAFTAKFIDLDLPIVESKSSLSTRYFNESVISRTLAFKLIFEGIGRFYVTMVVFSDIILGMTVTNWSDTVEMTHTNANSNNHEIFLPFLEAFIIQAPTDNVQTQPAHVSPTHHESDPEQVPFHRTNDNSNRTNNNVQNLSESANQNNDECRNISDERWMERLDTACSGMGTDEYKNQYDDDAISIQQELPKEDTFYEDQEYNFAIPPVKITEDAPLNGINEGRISPSDPVVETVGGSDIDSDDSLHDFLKKHLANDKEWQNVNPDR